MLSIEQRRAARRAFAREVQRSQTPQTEPATTKANVLGPPVAESPSSSERRPVRVAIVTPVLYVGGAEQWIASLAHWLDPDRAIVTKVIVLFPSAINPVAVSWLPRWVEVVDSRTIEQDGSFDVVITWGLKDLVERISHLTCPTIDVQHGVFLHESWQSPLVAAATRAHELYGTTIVGVNEAVHQNFPEHVRDKVVIIPNGSDPGRVHPLVDRNELRATLGLTPEHKVVVYIGRIAVEKNVQVLIDAVEHLDDSWHAVIVGPQYVPLERLGPRVHVLPAQRRIGNWLGIADVLCHPSDYESHCFSINEAWLAGVPVVSCDYLVNRLFEERHGPMMWLVPIRPELARLAAAIGEACANRDERRVTYAREVACREYAAPVMGRRWSELARRVSPKFALGGVRTLN
jgi:glycosyltransferase involved in cell wall biosynthesis